MDTIVTIESCLEKAAGDIDGLPGSLRYRRVLDSAWEQLAELPVVKASETELTGLGKAALASLERLAPPESEGEKYLQVDLTVAGEACSVLCSTSVVGLAFRSKLMPHSRSVHS